MDFQVVDPRSLDVGHEVDGLSFRFFSESEALRLSVRRITSPHAYDDLGRALDHGLYDPAMGPTKMDDGPCLTCSRPHSTCPGHFGHIELPFPLPNPLLSGVVYKLVRGSCEYCFRIPLRESDIKLMLARLYFEAAGNSRAGYAVDAYRGLRRRSSNPTNANRSFVGEDTGAVVKDWREFFMSMPVPLPMYLKGIDPQETGAVEKAFLMAARAYHKRQAEIGKLQTIPTTSWRQVEDDLLRSGRVCLNCKIRSRDIRRGEGYKFFRKTVTSELLISPVDIERHIAGTWQHHSEPLTLLYGSSKVSENECKEAPHRHLFVRYVLVPPNRFRPTSIVGYMDYAAEHPQNVFFQRILAEIRIIVIANEHGLDNGEKQEEEQLDPQKPIVIRPTKARLGQATIELQNVLKELYDSSGRSQRGAKYQTTGIRQQLEAKAGIFRMHMMGKRVNYSCRSVIGPDVFLDTDEVGIPESFAKRITIPEPVTAMNVDQMQRAVLNGPDVHPGAMAVEDWTSSGDFRVVKFRSSTKKQLLSSQACLLLQNRIPRRLGDNLHSASLETSGDGGFAPLGTVPKRVHRHLKTGDIVLFNRQPSLHRVSMMAHRVRVLKEARTIRFHYANCGSYNADFDGDEMNVHVPQDYIARAEAEELLLSSKHYILPTTGAPIRGLIQDHITAATLLSMRDCFLERETLMQLLYSATEKIMLRHGRIDKPYTIPVPAVLKPRPLWTGKQLISSLLGVVRNGRPGVSVQYFAKTPAIIVGREESQVIFRQGELLQGVLDKSSLGSVAYGIVHAVQEAYGCDSSDDFLSSMSRLCLFFMRRHGHTTGIADLVLKERGDQNRRKILHEGLEKVGVEVANSIYKQMSNAGPGNDTIATNLEDARVLIEEMVRRDGAEAEDRLDSGMNSALAKVRSDVMKKCVPVFLQRPFPLNGFSLMTSTGSKGSAVNAAQISCLLGSTELEGKRVPRMGGSGKTLPCFKSYDASPVAGGFVSGRFLTGLSPQEFFFHAMSGREGLLDTSLKTANSGYLQRCLVKHLEGVRLHYDGTVRDSDDRVLQLIYGDDGIDPCKAGWLMNKVQWQLDNRQCLQENLTDTDSDVKEVRKKLSKTSGDANETVLESLSPGALSKRGAISESFESKIQGLPSKEKQGMRQFLEGRYQKAAANPGEAVGVIAAQGVGEPSTQMTLNTFHHAGSSSAHVTSGIPRLRELLMSASPYPKTPTMTLPILCGDTKAGAELLRQRLDRVCLLDLLLTVEVREKSVSVSPMLGVVREAVVILRFPKEEVYCEHLGKGFNSIVEVVKNAFIIELNKLVRKEVKAIGDEISGRKKMTYSVSTYLRCTKLKAGSAGEEPQRVAAKDSGDEESPEEQQSLEQGQSGSKLGEEDSDSAEDEETVEDDDESSSSCTDSSDDRSDEKDQVETGANEDMEVLDEEQKALESLKSKSVEKKQNGVFESEANGSPQAPEAAQVPHSVAEVKLSDSNEACLGFVPESIEFEDNCLVRFKWQLPVAVNARLDLADVVQAAAKAVRITEIPMISRCFVEDKKGTNVITEGSNIYAMFEQGEGLIDFNRMQTNDMYGILHVYGVEAMRAALVKEFLHIFKSYGIDVNIRHLQLIADYMTVNGGYSGFNRRGMEQTPSLFQRITFETAVKFLTNAALNVSYEPARSPSTSLSLGQLTEVGTGAFELVQRVN